MEEDERIECYVCANASALVCDICYCKGRYIHTECQKKLIETLEKDGCCSVCREPYTNVQLVIHRSCNKKRICFRVLVGMFVGSGCTASALALCNIYTYFFISNMTTWSACFTLCPNSTADNVTCIDYDLENNLCVNLNNIIHGFIQAGFVALFLMASICIFAGVYFARLTRSLPKYHDRREIRFVSDAVSDTRVPASASPDEACAQSEETTERVSSDSSDTPG